MKKNGLYINIWDYEDPAYPFQIFCGSRGTGKTYSALKGSIDHETPFIYMRRTFTQIESIMDSKHGEGLNPFKPLNQDMGWNYGFFKLSNKVAGIYAREEHEDKFTYADKPVGYGMALSTVATIRGIDASDCTDWIYDEFIPEKHEKIMRGESDAVLNAYETFNRNREFNGKPALRLWMLSNSNDIYNPIFKGLGLIQDAEKLVAQGKEDKYYPERGLAMHILRPSDAFRDKKSQTALYRLTAGSEFADMALDNKFAYNDFSLVQHIRIIGFQPYCALGEGYFYRKKGERRYHCCYTPAPCPKFNLKIAHDRLCFKRQFGGHLADEFILGHVTFESFELKAEFVNVMFGNIV